MTVCVFTHAEFFFVVFFFFLLSSFSFLCFSADCSADSGPLAESHDVIMWLCLSCVGWRGKQCQMECVHSCVDWCDSLPPPPPSCMPLPAIGNTSFCSLSLLWPQATHYCFTVPLQKSDISSYHVHIRCNGKRLPYLPVKFPFFPPFWSWSLRHFHVNLVWACLWKGTGVLAIKQLTGSSLFLGRLRVTIRAFNWCWSPWLHLVKCAAVLRKSWFALKYSV